MNQNQQPSLLRLSESRESLQPTSSSFSGSRHDTIKIKHPNYPDHSKQNVLMVLYAFDRQGGGLHYGTALVACGLVAGNVWDGYFTLDRDSPRIELRDDDFLLEKSYYFHVPSSNPNPHDYAIYPSFEHWAFPHDNLPPAWSYCAAAARQDSDDTGLAPPSAPNLTAAILRRDGCCRVTKSQDYVRGLIFALEVKRLGLNRMLWGNITKINRFVANI